VIASVVFVASRPKHHPGPVSPSTTTPTTRAARSLDVLQPSALAVDADGTLYVADKGAHRIVKIFNGVTRLVAHVEEPRGLAFDHEGNLYVADNATNTVLRIQRRTATESTYAGDGTPGFAETAVPQRRRS